MARATQLHYLPLDAEKPYRTACNLPVSISIRTTSDLNRVTCTNCENTTKETE